MSFDFKSRLVILQPYKKHVWLVVCIALTLLKLWLVRAQSIYAVRALFDDELFITHAESLLRGEWLGHQSYLTMFKGPVYPMWLALSHLSGLPLLISQALLYALACWIFVLALTPVVSSSWARSVIYLAVLYNPASWDVQATTRVTRENIYSSLTLLLFALTIGTLLRIRSGLKASVLWGSFAGMVGSFFVMTREEGVWVLPSIIILLCWSALSSRKSEIRNWIITALCAAFAYLIPLSAVAYENWRHYGIYETCETTTDYFKSAYGALTRVKVNNWNPYVPVSKEAIRKISAVSPIFREIGPKLEEHILKWNPSPKELNVGSEIAGGWFIWAFRWAVNSAGIYESGMPDARTWYRQLSREIDNACSNGQLDCLPARSSLAPPWRNQYLPNFGNSLLRAGQFLTTFKRVSPLSIPSSLSALDFQRFESVTREQIPVYRFKMIGVMASRIGEVSAGLSARNRRPEDSIRIEPVQLDVGSEDNGYRYWRYYVEISDPEGEIIFEAKDHHNLLAVPVASSSKLLMAGNDNLAWQLESYVEEPDARTIQVPLASFRIGTLAVLTKVYSYLMPLFAATAFGLLLVRFVQDLRNKYVHATSVFAIVFLGAIAVRLLMLSFIDVSSFPAISTVYMSPAYVLYIAAVMLVLIHQVETILEKRHLTRGVNA